MSISRSLNFSLFQSSSKEEDFDEEDEEDDYDWGKRIFICIQHYLLLHRISMKNYPFNLIYIIFG